MIWDYIHRGMPLGKEGSLKPDEVYSLTAFLLYKNDVIKEDEVMDAQSLPKVKMPNRNGFALPPEWKHGSPGFRVIHKATIHPGSLSLKRSKLLRVLVIGAAVNVMFAYHAYAF